MLGTSHGGPGPVLVAERSCFSEIAGVKKEKGLWAKGDPSPGAVVNHGGAAGQGTYYVALGTMASPLRLHPFLELVTLSPV